MIVKDVVKCMGLENRLEIKRKSRIVWSGYVKEIDLDGELMEKECLIIEPFCNDNGEFGNRLTIENDNKIDDSFKIDKDITVGELLYNYASDTTVIRIVETRIVETSWLSLEHEEIIYEEYMGEFENDYLLNKKVVGIDCFIYDKDDAGLIIYIN